MMRMMIGERERSGGGVSRRERRVGARGLQLVCAGLVIGACVRAEETNQAQSAANPFAVSGFTLTGDVFAVPPVTLPQAMDDLKQKIQIAIAAKDYESALNYATAGLRVAPEDGQLLSAKAVALAGLHQYTPAIATLRELLLTQPTNEEAVCGLAELLLISNRVDEYRALASVYKAQIGAAYSGVLAKYFAVLEAYQTVDQQKFRAVVTETLGAFPAKQQRLVPGWQFGELLYALSKQPNSPKKTMLLTFVRVLQGEMARDEAVRVVSGSK